MTGLIKELRDASQDTSPGAKERLKLLQLAIQACQMQIEQLMNAAAQKAARKPEASTHSSATSATSDRKSAGSAMGAQIDTHA